MSIIECRPPRHYSSLGTKDMVRYFIEIVPIKDNNQPPTGHLFIGQAPFLFKTNNTDK